jgi:hypothetical protein
MEVSWAFRAGIIRKVAIIGRIRNIMLHGTHTGVEVVNKNLTLIYRVFRRSPAWRIIMGIKA